MTYTEIQQEQQEEEALDIIESFHLGLVRNGFKNQTWAQLLKEKELREKEEEERRSSFICEGRFLASNW